MRPKNSKDLKTRKRKVFLSSKVERQLIDEYGGGCSFKDLCEKYNISMSAISNMFKRHNVKCRVNYSHIKQWIVVNDLNVLDENIGGIYGIYFINRKNNNDIKLYIGSSVNIKNRLKDHERSLKYKSHVSKSLQKYYDDDNYQINYAIIKQCDNDSIMQEERAYQYAFHRSCLLNSWLAINESDLIPWLEKAVTLKAYKNYVIKDDGCWESTTIHKSGYGRLRVVAFKDWGPGVKKYMAIHRVAYWEKYGEYPELIRHKCNNPKCRNPDHLIKGNHRDNAMDKRGFFPEEFERKWLEFDGDVEKLTEHFGWKNNCGWGGKKISASVYAWEKKLDLRNKHQKILGNNTNRRS